MERKYKIYITFVIILMLIALSLVLALFEQTGLLIVCITCLVLAIIYVLNLIIENSSSKNSYQKELNYILKTYQNILVKSLDLIDLSNKVIIRTDNIEDLVNAQIELRKPIYYKCYDHLTTFVLLQDKEAIVYVIKEDKDIPDPTEFFTNDSTINLNELNESKTIKFRNKKIKIEVIDEQKDKKEDLLSEDNKVTKSRKKYNKK